MSRRPTDAVIEAIEDGSVGIRRRLEFYEKDGTTRWYPEGPTEDESLSRLLPEGSVNISSDRDERRLIDISLDNRDGLLRPHPDGFWYDKVLKPYRGLVMPDDTVEWWQLGEFVIDGIDDQRFPKTISVSGRDYTKRMLLSKLANSASWPAGTKLVDLIKALAANSGVTKIGLPTVAQVPTTLGAKLEAERGSDRWGIARGAAEAKGYALFFDSDGFLRMEKFVDPTTSALEWTFQTGPAGNLVDYSRSVNDSELYNVVQVESAAPETGVANFWEARNTEPSSPTCVQRIGERVMPLITLETVASQAQVKAFAISTLMIAALESYNLSFSSIYYPWFDVNKVVQVLEDDRIIGDPTRFLLTDIEMSFELGPMSNTAKRITYVGDVRDIVEIPDAPEDPSITYEVVSGG